MIHTAALLHDIGKFAWSDRILHPQSLTDEDWEVIRRHPQEGAELVGKLDGYGPGRGRDPVPPRARGRRRLPGGTDRQRDPARLAHDRGLLDVRHDDDGARSGSPLTPADAVAELRKVAGRQLDAELVERFVAMLERQGWAPRAHR